MSKGAIVKNIGKIDITKIDQTIVEKYGLEKYDKMNITQEMTLYMHVYKHLKEFKSIDNFNEAITSVDKIINKPMYVYYDKERESLLYFKELNEDVCAVVKLVMKKNKNPYVATIYPINKTKIEKLKERELRNKYIKN